MQSTGIMQEVKRLLEQGKRSGELIKMGFAPGTVYGVQRQFRRRAGMARTQDLKSSQLKGTPGDDVVILAGELGYCQGQRESFQIEVERLKAAEEEVSLLRLQITQLAGELRSMRAELDEAESRIERLKDKSRTLTQEGKRLGSEIQHQPNRRYLTICTYQMAASGLPPRRLQMCQYQVDKEDSQT